MHSTGLTSSALRHPLPSCGQLLPASSHRTGRMGSTSQASRTPNKIRKHGTSSPILSLPLAFPGKRATSPAATERVYALARSYSSSSSSSSGSNISGGSANPIGNSLLGLHTHTQEASIPDLLRETPNRLDKDAIGHSTHSAAAITTITPTTTSIMSGQEAPSVPTTNNAAPTSPPSYFTWLVFMKEQWVPFDAQNQSRLEQTLSLGGTFVDITDSHFPNVRRVRVFPKNNYLSYLGVKYRLSRIMQPDAWLDSSDIVLETNACHPDGQSR